MERKDYQERVLRGLRRWLLGPEGGPGRLRDEGTGAWVLIEEVRLFASGEAAGEIVVFYRDLERPGCLFGWRMEAVEPVAQDGSPPSDPESWTTVVGANFAEHVIGTPRGLPEGCSPEGVTWTG